MRFTFSVLVLFLMAIGVKSLGPGVFPVLYLLWVVGAVVSLVQDVQALSKG